MTAHAGRFLGGVENRKSGRIPLAVAGEVRIAPRMKTTLSVDHRVADGAQAGRFLQEFNKKVLENPVTLLTVWQAPFSPDCGSLLPPKNLTSGTHLHGTGGLR
jgi:hypothetical protein